MAPTKRIDARAASIAGMDRFRPRRGPPGDDALRAGSTTHECEGVLPAYPPETRWQCGRRPVDDAALSDMAKDRSLVTLAEKIFPDSSPASPAQLSFHISKVFTGDMHCRRAPPHGFSVGCSWRTNCRCQSPCATFRPPPVN